MTRRLTLVGIVLGAALLIGATPGQSTSIIPHVSSCGNTFPADGHNGPWRTTNVLHANTVKITCPSGSTHWDINYGVQYLSNGQWLFWTFEHLQGNGSIQFSDSWSPFGCSDPHYAFPIRTHVGNNVTGGNINKPSGGSGIINLC